MSNESHAYDAAHEAVRRADAMVAMLMARTQDALEVREEGVEPEFRMDAFQFMSFVDCLQDRLEQARAALNKLTGETIEDRQAASDASDPNDGLIEFKVVAPVSALAPEDR